MTGTILRPGDIVFWSSPKRASVLQRLITARGGEPLSWANHTSLVSQVGFVGTGADVYPPYVIEALVRHGVVERKLRDLRPGERIAVARPDLPEWVRLAIVDRARTHVGDRYTVWALLWHWVGADQWMPRWLAERVRICSRETGWAFDTVLKDSYGYKGFSFGKPAKDLDPDDVFDFVAREASRDQGHYSWVVHPGL